VTRTGQSTGGADRDTLSEELRRLLLRTARDAIRHGLECGGPPQVERIEELPEALREHRAAFVTLHLEGRLRGCIGHLEAIEPLVRDVADNAFAAAFRDPRFPPLRSAEFDPLHIEISVLSPATPLHFEDEAALIALLQPGLDGLILTEDTGGVERRGTFLPSVWDQLPEPRLFLRHLKQKAGLPADYWSEQIQVWRYRTESFGE
jgi:AmmeMemoRadiSam system protein A